MKGVNIIFIFITFIYTMEPIEKKENLNDPKNTSDQNNLKNQLLELGFDSEKIDLALTISSNLEEAVNLIVRMMEEPEFLETLKSGSNKNCIVNNNNKGNEIGFPINIIQLDQYKMVILVRKDLKMSIGKTAAQVAHAALQAYKISMEKNADKVKNWEYYSGTAKVVLGVDNYEELMKYNQLATERGIVTAIIHDAGRTEVDPGTATVCALGPDLVNIIDTVTGKLKLL